MTPFDSYSNTVQTQAQASHPAVASTSNVSSNGAGPSTTPSTTAQEEEGSKKKKATKRRKVNHACLYCRRSHMTCDEGRPCQRCIKREIGHLCHDERRPKINDKQPPAGSMNIPQSFAPVTVYQAPPPPQQPLNSAWPMTVPQGQFLYQPETLGNEFSVLSDFLETLDESSFFTSPQTQPQGQATLPLIQSPSYTNIINLNLNQGTAILPPNYTSNSGGADAAPAAPPEEARISSESAPVVLPAATKTEQFLLTAADQASGSRDERLNRVIRSKYEAGLLKPYNYVKGYARLSRWMDKNVSQESKQQILQPLSVLRPKFRAVAQSLQDMDLVFIEEAFERLLLDYDRVFSAMGVPACLWRRTGEIYKGNREFSELIGVEGAMLRDGRLCIYELMAEESAVNYWEKYGHVAFDSSQKAVLTSCVLRYKPVINARPVTPAPGSTPSLSKPKEDQDEKEQEEGFVNCCFSFTIRRDKWGIPTMIVGNFIKC